MLLWALLQVTTLSSFAERERAATITEAEARAMPARALADRVLGMAGDGMAEATVHGAWRAPFGGSIEFAARPIASGWDRLCTAATITVTFVADRNSAAPGLPHRVAGTQPGRRYRLLDRPTDLAPARACQADSPSLADAGRSGFFRLLCTWDGCDTPQTALLAAEVMSQARRQLAKAGFMRCAPSPPMNGYCSAAIRRTTASFATGFPQLSVQACAKPTATTCVTASVPPFDPRAQLSVQVATTLPIDRASTSRGRAEVTGVTIVMNPPVVVD